MKEPLAVGTLVEERGRVAFEEEVKGHLRIFEWPGPYCVIGADVAEGLEEDESAAVVLNCEFNATMAVFNDGKIDPDSYAIFLNRLGRFYHQPPWFPLQGVERNSVGFSVVSDLLKLYPKKDVYFHIRYDEEKKIKTKKFGWITNEQTKHLMCAYLKQEVRESSTDLHCKQLIHQCMQVVNEHGKIHASKGEKDDIVIARAIAGMMRRERPIALCQKEAVAGKTRKVY